MIMSWFFTLFLGVSLLGSIISGNGFTLASATIQGAQAGITLAISLAGSICLWTGVGKLMERIGITNGLSALFRPLLSIVFPKTKNDPVLRAYLSANICANLLGLGNAATPMGILAAKRMVDPRKPNIANDELCRLIVLNTASIQLIPANVAALRSSLGCASAFDILPAVWITSICSAGLGVCAAFLFGKVFRHD